MVQGQFLHTDPYEPTDTKGNLFPDIITSNVNLTEQFNPLINVSFELKNSFNVMELNDQIRNLLISMNLCSIKSMIQLSNLDLNDVIAFFHAKIYETLIFKIRS